MERERDILSLNQEWLVHLFTHWSQACLKDCARHCARNWKYNEFRISQGGIIKCIMPPLINYDYLSTMKDKFS